MYRRFKRLRSGGSIVAQTSILRTRAKDDFLINTVSEDQFTTNSYYDSIADEEYLEETQQFSSHKAIDLSNIQSNKEHTRMTRRTFREQKTMQPQNFSEEQTAYFAVPKREPYNIYEGDTTEFEPDAVNLAEQQTYDQFPTIKPKDNVQEKQPWLIARKKRKNIFLQIALTTISFLIFSVFVIGSSVTGAAVGLAQAYVNATPSLDIALIADQQEASMIYDRNGHVITSFIEYQNREWAQIGQIPDMLKNAFIAVEDVRFYQHKGIDLKRLFSVAVGILGNSSTGGGSTITQQLIKIQVLGNEQSYKRKVQEAYLAMELEKQYSKDQILEAYLNAIHLGDSNYGVKAAAEDYFGKTMDELTIRESAMLAGLTQNPNGYNPRKNMYVRKDMTKTNERTDTVLRRMLSAGFITQTQYDTALVEQVPILENSKVKQIYDMPSFVEYAIDNVITHMLRQENLQDNYQNRREMEKRIRTGGYRIYTTVDPTIQNTMQKTISEWDQYPSVRNPAKAVVKEVQKDGSVIETIQPQVGAVLMDQHTGEVLAAIGRRDPATRLKLLNRAFKTRMEVGSSIKPLSIYAPALENGASPGSIYLNYPVPIEGYGGTKGFPGGGVSNPNTVSMREGVRKSLNIVAARTLFETVTLEKSKDTLIELGINPSGINADGPGLALGTSAISPLEMAAAYAAIANGGTYYEPIAFSKVLDRQGNVVLDSRSSQVKRIIFQKATAWMMTDMLEDAVRSGTGTKARIPEMHVAGKTGTNSDYRSVYFVGYTPYYVSSLWIGHDNYQEDTKLKSGATGGTYAAPLWQSYMSKIHEGLIDKPILDITPASLGLVERQVCSVSGDLATNACKLDPNHKPITDWFKIENIPTQACKLHFEVKICTSSKMLATPFCSEHETKKSAFIILPFDSPLNKIPNEMLKKSFSNIVFGIDKTSLLSLTPEDDNYYQYYCSLHKEEVVPLPTPAEAIDILRSAQEVLQMYPHIDAVLYQQVSDEMQKLSELIEIDAADEEIGVQAALLKELLDRVTSEYSPVEVNPIQ